MGIQGLLPMLADITKTRHLSHFKGQKAGIDAYCWLHKAAVITSEDLAKG